MYQKVNKRDDLIFYEECYQIVGILYEVFNTLGHGHAEKVYQKGVSEALKQACIPFTEQLYAPVILTG